MFLNPYLTELQRPPWKQCQCFKYLFMKRFNFTTTAFNGIKNGKVCKFNLRKFTNNHILCFAFCLKVLLVRPGWRDCVVCAYVDYNFINFERLNFTVLRHSSSIQPASYLPTALLYLTRANIAWYLNNYLSRQIIKEKSLLGRQFPLAASFQNT